MKLLGAILFILWIPGVCIVSVMLALLQSPSWLNFIVIVAPFIIFFWMYVYEDVAKSSTRLPKMPHSTYWRHPDTDEVYIWSIKNSRYVPINQFDE